METREYSDTGYGPIDVEHRALSERIRKLIELVNAGKVAGVRPAMEELVAGVADHFAHEERLMREHRFPNTARHCEAHALFVADATSFASQLATKGITQDFRRWAVTRLVEWFRFHIMANDIELGRFLLTRVPTDARSPDAGR